MNINEGQSRMTEFTISTEINILQYPKTFGKLSLEGMYCLIDGCPLIAQGLIYDDISINTKEDVYNNILNTYFTGEYNIIFYDIDKNKLYIKNDELAVFPLYIYMNDKVLYISNNVWNIIKNIHDIKIDRKILYMHFEIFNVFDKKRTFFKEIFTPVAGSIITIDLNNMSIKEDEYIKDESKNIDKNLSIKDMALIMDLNLKKNYKIYKKKLGNKRVFFGNSGGLDSRLVPWYAKQVGLDICGITIGEEFEIDGIQTSSFANAAKLSSLYGFKSYKIPYNCGNWLDRFLLDIRNAPFIISDLFKNPYTGYPDDGTARINITGKPDHAAGIVELRPETYDIMVKAPAQQRLSTVCSLFCKMFARNDLQKVFSGVSGDLVEKHLESCLFDYADADVLTLIKRIMRVIISKHAPSCGGLESCNRLLFPIQHYYPHVYKFMYSYGGKDVFTKRRVLEELINIKFKELSMMTTQSNTFINKQDVKNADEMEKLLWYRGTGMNYARWGKTSSWINFAKKILSYKSEMFDSLLPGLTLEMLGKALYPYQINKFLKVKFMLHIIENGKFDLLDREEFKMTDHFESFGHPLLCTK